MASGQPAKGSSSSTPELVEYFDHFELKEATIITFKQPFFHLRSIFQGE